MEMLPWRVELEARSQARRCFTFLMDWRYYEQKERFQFHFDADPCYGCRKREKRSIWYSYTSLKGYVLPNLMVLGVCGYV